MRLRVVLKEINFDIIQKKFLLIAIALATYFLRLQIVILMKGKRSIQENISPENLLDELIPPIDFSYDTFEPYL